MLLTWKHFFHFTSLSEEKVSLLNLKICIVCRETKSHSKSPQHGRV